jgi:LemA protein
MIGVLWIVLIVIAIIVVAIIGLYNSLIGLRNQIKNSWAQIDVQLKRRADLIPNLIESVKGYMKHEKGVLTELTKARTAFLSADTMDKKAKASNMMSDTLKSLFAVSENYPQLRANENFMQLQEELTGTENKIAYSRQHYNDVVMVFNTKIQTFPNNMIANSLGFKDEQMFEASEKERENVKVKFD